MNNLNYLEKLQRWSDQYPWLEMLSSLSILLVVAFVANLIAKKIVVNGIRKLLLRVKMANTQIIAEHNVIRRISNIVPAVIILNGIKTVPHLSVGLLNFIQMLAQAFIVFTIALAISELLNVFNSIYQTNPKSRHKPIKGYLQLVKLVVYIVCGLMIFGVFLKKDVFTILAGFGAMAAVLMLVFQNTILSIVASVQISSYDMVRIGDWIQMSSLNADGTVIDMSLHTVTVENFDKTFTTVPTNRLVTDTFINWRGMSESGVRRIKRSINIDVNSVHFLSPEELERLNAFLILKPYLDQKCHEIEDYNLQFQQASKCNTRQLTNLGTFRAYMQAYLQQHKGISQTSTLMVRQLQPTSEGLPLEIYAFTATTAWVDYENIQSDIIDHLTAIIPEFGLKLYQAPSGADLRDFAGAHRSEILEHNA